MKQQTIRWVIALGTISVVSIIVIQIFWVKRAYDIRENEFNETIYKALVKVSDDFFSINETLSPNENPVKQFESNYYVVMVNSPIDANVLDYLLKKEFKERNIFTDFEYGIYDCDTEKMVYGEYVHNQLISNPIKKSTELPVWGEENYYFGVLFPSKTGYIINHMGTWVFTSVLLLILTGFFGYALVLILKQRRLSEIQKDFINNMTHEFKTPISTISVSAEVLKDPSIINDPERLFKYSSIIENENNRLKKQVDRVLQMALLDKDHVNIKNEDVDLHDLIRNVIQTFRISYPDAIINCKLVATNQIVQGDPLHLSNVVYNITENALKFSGENPRIEILTTNIENGIEIKINDNGPGIPAEFRSKIFKKFFRIPTGNVHNVKGFGLGLNYVQRMVKAHGGKILLENIEAGAGSTFIIQIPNGK